MAFLRQVNTNLNPNIMECLAHQRPDLRPGQTAQTAAQGGERDRRDSFLFEMVAKPFQPGSDIVQPGIFLPAAFGGKEQEPFRGVGRGQR